MLWLILLVWFGLGGFAIFMLIKEDPLNTWEDLGYAIMLFLFGPISLWASFGISGVWKRKLPWVK